MNRFQDIIGRVEEIREDLKLNKSKFSNAIGMKPQTYNNFVGLQGSKPNVDLIKGVVNAFNVNPMWMLNGIGPKYMNTDIRYPEHVGSPAQKVADSGVDYVANPDILKEIAGSLLDIKETLGSMEKRISTLETK